MQQKIQQMQILFISVQDRLLFRLNTTGQTEFKLWFTRRYVKLLWPVLQQMLEKTISCESTNDIAKQTMISLDHEQTLSKVNFTARYEEKPEIRRPLGEEPLLVSKIQLKSGPGNTQILCLHPEKGEGLDIAFDTTLLHTFCKLLAEGVKKTDWDFECRISDYTLPVSQTTH